MSRARALRDCALRGRRREPLAGLVLALYPLAFRRRYGGELQALALFVATPGLARAANGPFSVPATGASLALQALWMALFSLLALLSVRRGRRALG